jgi:hypothetical protein
LMRRLYKELGSLTVCSSINNPCCL